MILEDYGELMFLQTVLKKIGMDVDAIQNPAMMASSILKMNPDVLIMTSAGRRVNGLEMSKMVKRMRGLPHIVLIRAAGVAPDPDPNIEGWLESPVVVPQLLKVVAELCGVDAAVLEEKFQKLQLKEIEEEKARLLKLQGAGLVLDKSPGGNPGGEDTVYPDAADSAMSGVPHVEAPAPAPVVKLKPATLSDEARKARYDQFLQNHEPVESTFQRKLVQTQVVDLRKAQTDGADELERQRKAFVEELFKKKS